MPATANSQTLCAIGAAEMIKSVFTKEDFIFQLSNLKVRRYRNQYDFDSSPCGETVESSHFQTGDPVPRTWGRS